MSLPFHFFKRDVRHAAWLLALWLLLLVGEGLSAFTVPASPKLDFLGVLAANFPVFLVLKVLVLAVLVPQLIQEDPTVGSTAFWLTRPIGRSTLLLAKTAGLGLIIMIPVLVDLPVLIIFGLSPRELGLAVAEILVFQLGLVLPIAVLAAVTSNFARFAGLCLAFIVGSTALLAITTYFNRSSAVLMQSVSALPLANTRAWIGTIVSIVGGGLILTHQYLTRRSNRSLIFAIALIVAGQLIAGFWPWSLDQDMPLHAPVATFDAGKVTLDLISGGSLNSVMYNFSRANNIDISCVLHGVPPEFLIGVRTVTPRLWQSDGTPIKTLGAIPSIQFAQPATSAIAAALGGIVVPGSFFRDAHMTTLVSVDDDTLRKYTDLPVRLEDDFDFVVSRYELAAELPLVNGSRYDSGCTHVIVTGVVPRVDGVTVVIAETSANLRYSRDFQEFGKPVDPRQKGPPVYLLVNRSRREAAIINETTNQSSAQLRPLGGLILQESKELPFGGGGAGRSPVVDRQWLAGATLVRLDRIPLAEFRKTAGLEVPKLGQPWLPHRDYRSTFADTTSAQAGPPSPENDKNAITILIRKSGTVTIDGEPVTSGQLNARLLLARKMDPTVLIISEGKTAFGETVWILDACRAAGMTKIRMQTQ